MATKTNIRRALHMLTQGAAACQTPTPPDVVAQKRATRPKRKATAKQKRRRKKRVDVAVMPFVTTERSVPKKMQEIAEQVQKQYRALRRARGCQGVGLGEKLCGGKPSKQQSLRVYVEKKLSERECKKHNMMVPKMLWLPGMPEQIPTDVIPIGRLKRQLNDFKIRPAKPGISISHFKEKNAGTLGCVVVKKGTTLPLYILSNAHVLSRDSTADQDDPIIQPGGKDKGTAADVIATLSESVKFEFGNSTRVNTIDAAISKVKGNSVSKVFANIDVQPRSIRKTFKVGDHVKKVGRTTDLTIGIIEDVDFTTRPLKYLKPGGSFGMIEFHHQVLCTRFTDGGDSGSCVLNSDNRIIGLHFAGSESKSVFNRISLVLDAFGIALP